MAEAYHTKAYAMLEIAKFFGVSTKTVSRAAKRHRETFTAETVSDFGVDPTVDTDTAVDATSVGIKAQKIV
jgi:transposase